MFHQLMIACAESSLTTSAEQPGKLSLLSRLRSGFFRLIQTEPADTTWPASLAQIADSWVKQIAVRVSSH